MNHPNDQIQSSSVTFSMLISEAVYKVVIAVERGISRIKK